ncbi:MAG TPA: hypothetical protein VIV66_01560, partial [Pyrinomonadaceae bacterium]
PAMPESEAGSMYTPSKQTPTGTENGGATAKPPSSSHSGAASANGHKAVDFVSEDDVRRAIQKGEKIYINGRTIITPAARDIGEPGEVFAKA